MATGMVLIIVSRNIDLSVGSVMAVVGMAMAMLQSRWIPTQLGLGFEQPYTWIVTVAVGLGLGALIGGLNGLLVAYVGIPSFVVTLGGLLVWRSVTIIMSSGQTVSQLDPTFLLLGGGPKGSAGETISWIIGIAVCVGIVYALYSSRRKRLRYGFPVRPRVAEIILGVLGCAGVLWAVNVANSYPWPARLAQDYATEHGLAEVPVIGTGIAYPVLLAIGVAAAMTILATRRRLGRYVYAIGGNPEAAELSGINTRRILLWTFVIMGVLGAVGAIISIARTQSATANAGEGMELSVIAAAVIGGTSFAGGIGTIPGAVLGALIIQSIITGMQLMRYDNSVVQIAVGVVLVVAVGIDTVLRKRSR
jgi:D-xylose transport system permease protein